MILALQRVPILVDCLHKWSEIEETFHQMYNRIINFSVLHKSIYIMSAWNLLFFAIAINHGIRHYKECFSKLQFNCKSQTNDFTLFSWTLINFAVFCNFFLDTSVIMLFSAVHLAFKQLIEQVDRTNDECVSMGKRVTKSMLKDFCHIVSRVRSQAVLVNRIIGPSQALHVFMLFTLLVLSLYLLFNKIAMNSNLPSNVILKTLMCCFGFVRMFIKATYCDSVRNEVR